MTDVTAVRVAIDLLHFPSKSRKLRDEALPVGVDVVLQIAAGEADVIGAVASQLERSPDTLIAAARFYVEQVLLAPQADHYRVLGGTSSTSVNDLRRHMALLIKAMHPDAAPQPEQRVFVNRITQAWDALKTADRRVTYDAQLASAQATPQRPASRQRPRRVRLPVLDRDDAAPGFLRRSIDALLAPRSAMRVVVVVSLATLAAWKIVTHTLASSVASTAPSVALGLNAIQPSVLLTQAETALADYVARPATADRSALNIGQVREWVDRVLQSEPSNPAALRLLGQLASIEGDRDRARGFMQRAVGISRRETLAVLWLLEDSLRTNTFAAAIDYADVVLRTRPDLRAKIIPVLPGLMQQTDAKAQVMQVLRANPPWRLDFFKFAGNGDADPRLPLEAMLDLKDTPHPPTSLEIANYVDVLFKKGLTEIAYYAWLQFLPPEQLATAGLLFNGSFDTKTTGVAFDWSYGNSPGVTIELGARTEEPGRRALFLDFGDGRVSFSGVTQTVLLAPGSYTVSGVARGKLTGRRGLTWRVTCQIGGILGETTPFLGGSPAWSPFSFQAIIPEQGCAVQQLTLVHDARSASEQLLTGTFWFDDIVIKRLPPKSP